MNDRTPSTLQIDPISTAGGAVITGLDLSAPLSLEDIVALRGAFLEYGMIVIRDQELEDEDQIRFCNAMGGIATRGKPADQRAADSDAS